MKETAAGQIEFSRWTHWATRNLLSGIHSPGVYLLAKFTKAPDDPANPQDGHILYIGETCQKTLQKRWQQFHRSAFQGKRGHSGGATYRREVGDSGDNLYVAAFSVTGLDENIRPLFIRYVERKLIWEYALKHGAAPKCNRK